MFRDYLGDLSTIPVNGIGPARNAATHPRWPRCRRPGGPPAARLPGQPHRREGLLSSGSNVQVWALVQSTAGAASATRSGQPSASAIGIRMSGGLAWAMVDRR